MVNGKREWECSSFAVSFFTFNEAQEFLLDNLLSELGRRAEGRALAAWKPENPEGAEKKAESQTKPAKT